MKLLVGRSRLRLRKIQIANVSPVHTAELRIIMLLVDRIPNLVEGLLPNFGKLGYGRGGLREAGGK